MGNFLLVVLSVLVTLAVSLISIPFTGILSMLILGSITSVVREMKLRFIAVYICQFIAYTASDFLGLILGALILRKSGYLRLLPLLYIVIVLSSILYAMKKYSFATPEAARHNKWQKTASFFGSFAAIILIYNFVSKW